MSISKYCKLCDITVGADTEEALETALQNHKASSMHSKNKESKESKKQERAEKEKEKLIRKYYPNLLD